MATFVGTSNSEIITGTRFRDIIEGRGGNDLIRGREGDDDLYGDGGNDDIYGNSGADYIWGGSGINDMWGGSGADRFFMSERGNLFSDDWIGDFTLDVDRIDVSAWGVSDFSQLDALFRTDSFGDAYINAYYDGENHFLTIADVKASELITQDFIYANPGALDESGTEDDDVMFGSDFNDDLSGLVGQDVLLGGLGDDDLDGGAGADHLIGGEGDDVLTGGRGRDKLQGDDGSDIFDFNNINESRLGNRSDVILDFDDGADLIDLAGIDANSGTGGNQVFVFIGSSDFTAAGQIRFENDGGKTIIYGNTDADLDAEFRIVVNDNFTPTDADFIV